MTGKITVGTIQDTDGNTVASTYVTNGVAKAWVNYNHGASITVRDSLNQASMTDFGVGFAFTNFTNNFATLGYCQTASGRAEGQAVNGSGNNLTSRVSYVAFNGSGAQIDCDTNCIACNGDLA